MADCKNKGFLKSSFMKAAVMTVAASAVLFGGFGMQPHSSTEPSMADNTSHEVTFGASSAYAAFNHSHFYGPGSRGPSADGRTQPSGGSEAGAIIGALSAPIIGSLVYGEYKKYNRLKKASRHNEP